MIFGLAADTVATYVSYMTIYIQWVKENLPVSKLNSITQKEMRSYFHFLRDVRGFNPMTVNIHIAQLRDFYHYVFHKDLDRREVPFFWYDEYRHVVPTREGQVNAITDSI